MSSFHERFVPDPELEGTRWLWTTKKPIFSESVVTFAPPYPEYPKLKIKKSLGSPEDPSSPTARVVSDTVQVACYAAEQGVGSAHEKAWDYLLNHAAAIEAALRRKLKARHAKSLQSFVENDLPEMKSLQKYWKEIQGQVDVESSMALDQFFKLVSIGLADHGLDECGFVAFDFQTGWDRDHGLEIVMHKDRVLAAGGMQEIISAGASILDAAKSIQAYDLDEGDYALQG